jgi:hypothetical protein
VAYKGEQNRLKINKNTVEPGKNILILEMGVSLLKNVNLHENLKKYINFLNSVYIEKLSELSIT